MIKQNITESLKANYMPYSAHVIMNRALPEIDGFKPSQRRILYTMFKMGLLGKLRKKSQGVVGQTMFIHAHGDASIYETMVRMADDNEALLVPYIDSKGNFGKVYSRDMKEAHSRYTEVKLSEISSELFKDIDKNTVDMIDSYDGSMKEPRMLPVTFPTILTNPSSGMAVGMASSIAPFNLSEVIDYTIAYIKDKESNVSDYIKAPDFPTGGSIVYNKSAFKDILDNGRGSFKIRASYKIDGNSIIFEEIPYTTTFEAIIDRVTTLIKGGDFKEIVDINDIYGINTKGIEIVVKENTDKESLIERLYLSTPLESSFGCNFNLIVEGKPKTLGFKDVIYEWVKFRVNTVRRGAKYDMDNKQRRSHLLNALESVLLNIDKAIKIIKDSKNDKEVISSLMDSFKIDEQQAEYVAEIKLRHLNKEYLINKVKEISKLNDEIIELKKLIEDRSVLEKFIVNQLIEIKNKYGEERKTKIIKEKDIPVINLVESGIENYNVKIFITEEGYMKKIPLTSLRGNFEIRVKDGDKIVEEIEVDNMSEVLVFTDKQNVYKLKCYDIENSKPSNLGDYLPSYLNLKDEKVIYATATKDFTENLLVGFDDGKLAKIELSAYETKNNRSVLRNAYADKKAIYFNKITEDIDLFAVATDKKAVLMNTEKINAKTSRGTVGVNFIRLREKEAVRKYKEIEVSDIENYEYYRLANAGVGKYLK